MRKQGRDTQVENYLDSFIEYGEQKKKKNLNL